MTLWTVAHWAPLFMEFSSQEYWSGLPFSSPRDLPDPRIEPGSPPLQADSLCLSHQGIPVFSKNQLFVSLYFFHFSVLCSSDFFPHNCYYFFSLFYLVFFGENFIIDVKSFFLFDKSTNTLSTVLAAFHKFLFYFH